MHPTPTRALDAAQCTQSHWVCTCHTHMHRKATSNTTHINRLQNDNAERQARLCISASCLLILCYPHRAAVVAAKSASACSLQSFNEYILMYNRGGAPILLHSLTASLHSPQRFIFTESASSGMKHANQYLSVCPETVTRSYVSGWLIPQLISVNSYIADQPSNEPNELAPGAFAVRKRCSTIKCAVAQTCQQPSY
jgi:hypothetical protein